MEGINPTLTFLVMVLGLSGNARDTADPAVAIEREAGCPVPIILGALSKEDTWANAFWDSAASASVVPGVIEPKWADLAAHGTEPSAQAGDDAPPAFAQASDSIMRRTVPTSTSMLLVHGEPDPCMPQR